MEELGGVGTFTVPLTPVLCQSWLTCISRACLGPPTKAEPPLWRPLPIPCPFKLVLRLPPFKASPCFSSYSSQILPPLSNP